MRMLAPKAALMIPRSNAPTRREQSGCPCCASKSLIGMGRVQSFIREPGPDRLGERLARTEGPLVAPDGVLARISNSLGSSVRSIFVSLHRCNDAKCCCGRRLGSTAAPVKRLIAFNCLCTTSSLPRFGAWELNATLALNEIKLLFSRPQFAANWQRPVERVLRWQAHDPNLHRAAKLRQPNQCLGQVATGDGNCLRVEREQYANCDSASPAPPPE